MSDRFTRLPPGTIGGLKLADRQSVNPDLSNREATDVDRFGERLHHAFGSPDRDSDADYSYILRDNQTGIAVRAYSAQSGPAYGGMPDDCFVDFEGGDYRLKPEVARTLAELDRWLENRYNRG